MHHTFVCICMHIDDDHEDISGFVGGVFEDDIISSSDELKRFVLNFICVVMLTYDC